MEGIVELVICIFCEVGRGEIIRSHSFLVFLGWVVMIALTANIAAAKGYGGVRSKRYKNV